MWDPFYVRFLSYSLQNMHVLVKPIFLLYYGAFYLHCLYHLLEGVYPLHEAAVSGTCWKLACDICNLCGKLN